MRSLSEVSNQPNPPDVSGSLENNLNHSTEHHHHHLHHGHRQQNQVQNDLDLVDVRRHTGGSNTPSEEDFGEDGVYGRNITYYSETAQLGGEGCESPTGVGHNERLNVKDLTINDIGRFQYILQMDREVVSVCVRGSCRKRSNFPSSFRSSVIECCDSI